MWASSFESGGGGGPNVVFHFDEEEALRELEAMDASEDQSAPSEPTVAAEVPLSLEMPEPNCLLIYSPNGEFVEFPAHRMTTSCPSISPLVLNGLYAVDDLTRAHKKAVSAVFALPMLVSASPAVAFCMRKSKQLPHLDAVQSWLISAASLRQLVFAASAEHSLVAFHPSVTPQMVDQHYSTFQRQISAYELDVFAPRLREAKNVTEFIACCEASSFFYLHACEQFIYHCLIAPHCGHLLQLADVLTPRTTYRLEQCSHKQQALACVQSFFVFKQTGLRDTYNDEFPAIQQEELHTRLAPNSGYANYLGYVDAKTLHEYWDLCKYIFRV